MPVPLEKFFEQTKNIQPKDEKMVDIGFDNLNAANYKNNVLHCIETMDDYNLCMFLKNNIESLCQDIMREQIAPYAGHFQNDKFVNALIKAISSIPITNDIVVACNRVIYDYFTLDNADKHIKQLYLTISKIVNKDLISSLMGLGLDEDTASNLAICRHSSMNEKTNVKRLNFTIYFKDSEIMTEQKIVWIYEKMFDRVSDLFQAIMFETYTPQQEEVFNHNFPENYSTVSLAILCILNNMTSVNIRRVLLGYYSEWEYKGKPRVRFSMRALSNDYSRIINVVESLAQEGTYIP